jgi:flagellar basal-body rod protein FlgC
MNFMTAMEIAASGLSATRERMNVTASNLANAQTTRTAEGGPYRRKDVVQRAAPVGTDFRALLNSRLSGALRGVTVEDVVVDQAPPRTIYQPGHPDANGQGFVELPNVNMVEEMVNMIMASRAYEAGVSTLQTVKQMANRALSIGK